MSEKQLIPWVIALEGGEILAAHCNCVAGLGETCSHVASLLWVVSTGIEKKESLTVTQKEAYWVIPAGMQSVPYAPGEIDFIGKKRKRSNSCTSSSIRQKIPPASDAELSDFLKSLASLPNNKPAVLAVVPPHCDVFIPASLNPEFPMFLTDLYKAENLSCTYPELLQMAADISISVTLDQCQAVEASTRNQADSRLWFQMRAGRITASKFKQACRTDLADPSKSLIMSICYPELSRFRAPATVWGCRHEVVALEKYVSQNQHENLQVSKCGFSICSQYPFIGSSPDRVVECQGCGCGICEIKVG